MTYKYIWFLPVLILCWSCAQQGSPSGGPRDFDPPAPIESEPPNYSTRFEATKIQITFDEYIVLDNVNQQLIVSPPMEEKPEVKLKKKTLIIEFEEELKANTTYTFNFGDAIKDLHEGNKLQNYEYVFSTGDVLDSLSVKGTLKYAENLEIPDEPVSIMLYADLRDSVPLLDIPLYVGRSNDSGVFSVNNLRPDEYKVFALKDANSNFLFDQPTEEIAFLDSSLVLNAAFARQLLGVEPDSVEVFIDSTEYIADTTGVLSDSIQEAGPDYNSIYIDLMLFTEESELQYLTDYTRDDRRKIQLIFARPLTDTFSFAFMQAEEEEELRFLDFFSKERDSLILWVMDSLHYKKDSLQMVIDYTVKDTSELYVSKTDTLLFAYREKESRNRRKQSEEEEEEKLLIQTIKRNGNQNLNQDLTFGLDFPMEATKDSLISLYQIPDSVEVPVPFVLRTDSTSPYRARLSVQWEPGASYHLVALPGAFKSIYPIQHDTLDVSFRTQEMEYYGQILLTLENVPDSLIVQLISNKTLFRETTVTSDGQYKFPFLAPKEYSFKFIHDYNGNGKWDTGNYMEKLQPEPVELMPGTVNVRSNWDHDVSIRLKK